MTATTSQGDSVGTSDTVDLRVPADPAYLSVVRSAAAAVAARLDLTVDEIENLRIAVDEASALLLDGHSHEGSELTASFHVGSDGLQVVLCGPARFLPEQASFAWSVLAALAGTVDTGADAAGSWIRLSYTPDEGPSKGGPPEGAPPQGAPLEGRTW